MGLDEELCQLFDQHLSHVFASQTLHTVDYATPDQQTYMPEYDDQGAVTSVLVLSTDISEMKQALQALQESETRFRLLADQVPHFIWMSGPGDPRQGIELEYSNQSFLSYIGESTAAPIMGRTWESVLHPDDRERVYEVVADAWKVRQAYSVECRFREAASEQFRWILLKGGHVWIPKGRLSAILARGRY